MFDFGVAATQPFRPAHEGLCGIRLVQSLLCDIRCWHRAYMHDSIKIFGLRVAEHLRTLKKVGVEVLTAAFGAAGGRAGAAALMVSKAQSLSEVCEEADAARHEQDRGGEEEEESSTIRTATAQRRQRGEGGMNREGTGLGNTARENEMGMAGPRAGFITVL
eukprot:878218-Rhodomonas_salina.1